MRTIRVVFANGNSLVTDINGTESEIRRYYLGQRFNIGDPDDPTKDNMQEAVSVEFLVPTGATGVIPPAG